MAFADGHTRVERRPAFTCNGCLGKRAAVQGWQLATVAKVYFTHQHPRSSETDRLPCRFRTGTIQRLGAPDPAGDIRMNQLNGALNTTILTGMQAGTTVASTDIP